MITILLVEDNDLLRRAFTRGLVGDGFTVLDEANGHEAARTHLSFRGDIDVIILDLSLSDMTGYEWLRIAQPAVPVLVVSGAAPSEPLPACVAKVALKPIGLDDLAAAVREVLGGRK